MLTPRRRDEFEAVRELTGEPGDVVLIHPRTLHAAAPNAGDSPRTMLVEIVGRGAPRARPST